MNTITTTTTITTTSKTTKRCSKCRQFKKNEAYHRTSNYCKPCHNEYAKAYNCKRGEGHWSVYILSNYDDNFNTYCGMTKSFEKRMAQHRYDGRNTNESLVLATFETREEALACERGFHAATNWHGSKRNPGSKK